MTTGRVGDITQAHAPLDHQAGGALFADKADDGNALHAIVAGTGAKAVIASNRCRTVTMPRDANIYKHRNRINAASASSSNSDASLFATTGAPPPISPPP